MRLKEHQRAVCNGDVNASAITEHVWHEQHRMDCSAAEVVDSKQYLCPSLIDVGHSQRTEPLEQGTWIATNRVLLTYEEIQ
jgi:hypothetical protein